MHRKQGFPNNVKGWEGMKNIAVGEFLCWIVGVCLRRSNFDNLNFFKANNNTQ